MNNKYSTVTEQVKYVRKKLELLDEAKILFLQNRAEKLNQEVKATWQATQQDAQQQLIDKRAREFGHNKEIIDQLYKNGKGVLPIAEQVPNIVDRLEQKRKVQDMAAHIFVTIERMETQQQAILKQASQENKDVIQTLQKGITENSEVIKDNMVMLKEKMGIKPKVPEVAKE